MRRLASGGKWRWLPGSGLGRSGCGEREMQAQAGEVRMQQQFLRPGRSRCGGGVPPIPRRQQKAHLPDARSHRWTRHRPMAEFTVLHPTRMMDSLNTGMNWVIMEGLERLRPLHTRRWLITCNKRQAPKQLPVMKVGSMVLLMSSKYPNKANVAYTTLLSTDPEAIVGGVKTGSQFYKVHIDHAIAKDEPLVRPRPGCNNIGDAQAKGVSIAWPSMVQMING
ncbi:uncharacterized protein [Miscanthus floridulus]|uniref:uncharacterized protein isoform X2 n=1 Tax=Miscanthus floridulus TaxID=154761 RepID=UPI00345744CE